MSHKVGDKVRLKGDELPGGRGVLEAVQRSTVVVRLEGSGHLVRIAPEQVTNYSLAARKAWLSMPKRRVGRPKGLRLCDRVSVTLRIDRDLWEQFRALEESGVIDDRTATVNSWLRERLAELSCVEPRR